jgi:hypothetical protein
VKKFSGDSSKYSGIFVDAAYDYSWKEAALYGVWVKENSTNLFTLSGDPLKVGKGESREEGEKEGRRREKEMEGEVGIEKGEKEGEKEKEKEKGGERNGGRMERGGRWSEEEKKLSQFRKVMFLSSSKTATFLMRAFGA